MKKDKLLKLPQVTLVAITSVHLYETVCALKYSRRNIEFGQIKLLADKRPFYLPNDIKFEKIQKLSNIDEYSHFCVYDLADYIDTQYALIVHHDGFVVNPSSWKKEFLDYDYVGSPWPLPKDDKRFRDEVGNVVRVGNGVSLRSKLLMEYPRKEKLLWEKTDSGDYNEDCFLCCKYRKRMEEAGIKYAPFEVAVYFGREHILPENENIDPFLFHQWRGINKKYPRFINVLDKLSQKSKKMFWRIGNKLGISMTEKHWQNFLQVVHYLMVGIYNTLVSYLVYALFLLLGFGYLQSNAISFCFSILNSFIGFQKFVFHGTNKWYIMLGKVAFSYVWTGLILQEVLLYIWIDKLGISSFIAPIYNILIITPINFVIQKLWAYK